MEIEKKMNLYSMIVLIFGIVVVVFLIKRSCLVGDGCLKRAQRQAKLLNIWESNWSNINSISLIRTV